MSLNILYNILTPKFASLSEESEQVDVCTAITVALNDWFNIYFSKLVCGIYGVVTFPDGAVTPMGTKLSPVMICKPVTQMFHLTTLGVKTALSVPTGAFVSLFNYIATMLTANVTVWNSVTVPTTIPCIMPLVTQGAFNTRSMKLQADLMKIRPDEKNIPKKVWDMFEEALIDSLNQVPTSIVEYTGVFGAGIFTGIAEVNFRSTV